MLPTIRKPTTFDIARLFFLGTIWGGAFIFISLALIDFEPISLAAWRVFLGALVMVVIIVRCFCIVFGLGQVFLGFVYYLGALFIMFVFIGKPRIFLGNSIYNSP